MEEHIDVTTSPQPLDYFPEHHCEGSYYLLAVARWTFLLLVVALALFVDADAAAADAVCGDGTYSYSEGSGTCSWHGGVVRWVPEPTAAVSSMPGLGVGSFPYERSWWDENGDTVKIVAGLGGLALWASNSSKKKSPPS